MCEQCQVLLLLACHPPASESPVDSEWADYNYGHGWEDTGDRHVRSPTRGGMSVIFGYDGGIRNYGLQGYTWHPPTLDLGLSDGNGYCHEAFEIVSATEVDPPEGWWKAWVLAVAHRPDESDEPCGDLDPESWGERPMRQAEELAWRIAVGPQTAEGLAIVLDSAPLSDVAPFVFGFAAAVGDQPLVEGAGWFTRPMRTR